MTDTPTVYFSSLRAFLEVLSGQDHRTLLVYSEATTRPGTSHYVTSSGGTSSKRVRGTFYGWSLQFSAFLNNFAGADTVCAVWVYETDIGFCKGTDPDAMMCERISHHRKLYSALCRTLRTSPSDVCSVKEAFRIIPGAFSGIRGQFDIDVTSFFDVPVADSEEIPDAEEECAEEEKEELEAPSSD